MPDHLAMAQVGSGQVGSGPGPGHVGSGPGSEPAASGIERAVFGAGGRADIDGWLDRHLRARLGSGLARVLFRSGRIAAVYGVALADGREVAVKVHRRPADTAYLAAAVACQRRLAAAGYPCPAPLDGPAATGGLTAVTEMVLTGGEPGNAREPGTRRAMAAALYQQVDVLGGSASEALRTGAPAWARYGGGPWPPPHDPVFDFSVTPPGFRWLDELADRVAHVLRQAGPPDAVAHGDWTCGNLRFAGGRVSCSYDWDSVAAAPEPALVGFAAGSFTEGSTAGPDTPTPAEVSAFVQDYEQVRGQLFSRQERLTAAAAATWVLSYNARCQLFLTPGGPPPAGSALHALSGPDRGYLALDIAT